RDIWSPEAVLGTTGQACSRSENGTFGIPKLCLGQRDRLALVLKTGHLESRSCAWDNGTGYQKTGLSVSKRNVWSH
ncbi:hypothetical protein AVEN_112458-1, partial [Araneus ventricosus]